MNLEEGSRKQSTGAGPQGRARLPHRRARAAVAALALCASALACASPARRFDRQARSLGLERREIAGAGYRHAVFQPPTSPARGAFAAASPARLHLYLGDDGTPWVESNRVARDPTPRSAVPLELMASDPNAAALLGRPCYHGVGPRDLCSPLLWTHGRYSESVVESLAAAARALLRSRGARELVLFGYSGGGTLAMLMAARLPQTLAVVTVAANLDTSAWTSLHGHTPLRASLNPSRQAPLTAEVRQLHLAGQRDRIVPPEMVRNAASRQPNAEFRSFEDFDHSCCWREVWPEVLEWVAGG